MLALRLDGLRIAVNSLIDKKEFQKALLDSREILRLSVDEEVGYMEFGCGSGDGLLAAREAIGVGISNYAAFDSFQGLPKPSERDSKGLFREGQFSFSQNEFLDNLTIHGFPLDKLDVYAGFFDLTFPVAVDLIKNKNFKFFVFDCDLYSSTKEALEFFVDFFKKECIVVFDDWFSVQVINEYSGQAKAFYEFMEKHSDTLFAEWIGTYDYYGRLAGKYYHVEKI